MIKQSYSVISLCFYSLTLYVWALNRIYAFLKNNLNISFYWRKKSWAKIHWKHSSFKLFRQRKILKWKCNMQPPDFSQPVTSQFLWELCILLENGIHFLNCKTELWNETNGCYYLVTFWLAQSFFFFVATVMSLMVLLYWELLLVQPFMSPLKVVRKLSSHITD